MKKVLILSICLFFLVTACTNNDESKKEVKKEETTKEIVLVTEDDNKELITDDQVVEYISNVTDEVVSLENEKSLSQETKESLKNTFITLTDFIFYDGTIKGKTFKDLTMESKEKILELYEKIDAKIENVYPNYKDEIKDTSTKIYSKAKEKTTILKEYLKKNYIDLIGEEAYQKEIEAIDNAKENIKEKATPIINTTKEKTKEVYESTKDKLNTWYQGIKESS